MHDPAPRPTSWVDRLWSRRALWLRPDLLVAGALVVAALVGAVLWWWPATGSVPTERVEATLPLATAPTAAPVELHVHAAGAVRQPGLYRMPAGARVADVIDAAGGVTPEADLDRINLAAPVTDGGQVFVPVEGEAFAGASPGAPGAPQATGPIDLNTADAARLEALPGVGPATAQAIVTHRDEHGPFASVDGLLDVSGIGPAKLDAVRDLVVAG
ncbi:MAG: helix-hairpin-helix domain-containing protein [Actinomycetota bacterium]